MEEPLIHREAYKVVSSTFCALAITGAISRTVIRTLNHQLRLLDDFLLLLACICLITSTVLLNEAAPTLYTIGLFGRTGLAVSIPKALIIQFISKIQRYSYPFGTLIWTTIFLVKFSYLAFFRLLIDRQRPIIIYWRIAMLVTGIAAVFNISSAFIGCAKFGDDNYLCSNAYYTRRILAVEAVTISLDIITDLLILVVPLYLLHKVRIRLAQKVGVGSFLCLSSFMVIIAVIRISRVHETDFEVWASFWQQFEGCIAVLMISLTAFRTLFITKQSSASDAKKPKASDTYRRRLWFSKRSDGSEGQRPQVPVSIPGGVLTGMRAFIRGGDSSRETSSMDSVLRSKKETVNSWGQSERGSSEYENVSLWWKSIH